MAQSIAGEASTASAPSWMAYVLPVVVFALMTALEGYAPREYYPWIYLAKVILVTIVLVVCRRSWSDMRPTIDVLPVAVLVGLAVIVQWVALDKLIAYPHIGTRTALNPFTDIESPGARLVFLAARFYGLVLVVPLMEEVFWRSFLLRYITDPDFTKLPHGTFSMTAFAVVALTFGISHTEWLAAIITACAYALLLRHTRSLFACFIAHLVSNLALAIYVLKTGEWMYW
jgi:CAAX prenyl protease-like protein